MADTALFLFEITLWCTSFQHSIPKWQLLTRSEPLYVEAKYTCVQHTSLSASDNIETHVLAPNWQQQMFDCIPKESLPVYPP